MKLIQVNHRVVEQKAHQIGLDIITGNVDESLRNWKPQLQKPICTTIDDLHGRFIAHKAADIAVAIKAWKHPFGY